MRRVPSSFDTWASTSDASPLEAAANHARDELLELG